MSTEAKQIEINYCCKASIGNDYAAGSRRFADWYQVADWLLQETLQGPVLISSWRYL